MFKVSVAGGQMDIFDNIYHHVGNKKSAILADEKGWHNIFFKHITSQIDEAVCSE